MELIVKSIPGIRPVLIGRPSSGLPVESATQTQDPSGTTAGWRRQDVFIVDCMEGELAKMRPMLGVAANLTERGVDSEGLGGSGEGSAELVFVLTRWRSGR